MYTFWVTAVSAWPSTSLKSVDCVRMLEASDRDLDIERLQRLRRLMELERQLVPQRRLTIER